MNINNVKSCTKEAFFNRFKNQSIDWNTNDEAWIGSFPYDILSSAFIAGSPGMPGLMENGIFHVHAEAFSYSDHTLVAGLQDWYKQTRFMTEQWLGRGGSDKPLELSDTWCFIAQPWSNVFWHWLCEGLVKIAAFEAAGFTGGYIVPAQVKFVRRSLELLNIDPQRLYFCDAPYVHVERLIVPHRFRAQIDLKNHLDAIDWLRARLAPDLPTEAELKIYVARAEHRSIVNEGDLLSLLDRHGFQQVSMERLDLADQIALVSRAGIFAGPHGSGFAHTMFMPRRSSILEIFSPTYVNPCMLSTIKHLNQDYSMIVGYTDSSPDSSRDSPIIANLDLVSLALDRAEKLSRFCKSN